MSEPVATTPSTLFMGELVPPTGLPTKLPALPTPSNDLDAIRVFLQNVKEILEVYEGIRGSKFDQVVTWRDMFQNGMVDLTVSGTRFTANPTSPFINLPTVSDYTPPPAPTGFSVSSGMTTIILSWNAATYGNHAYTEVWRSDTNNLANALLIGTTNSFAYADSVGFTGSTKYYWIRFVSKMNVIGPYNNAIGTGSSTGLVGTADLTDLIITANKIAVGAITNTKIADAAINSQKLADLAVIASKLADNSVTTSKISDASVVGAKLASLAVTAEKIATGAIDLGGTKITGLLANLNLDQITDATKIADSLISNSKLSDLAVDAAKLANSSVTSTKIANLAVGTAAIQTAAITSALIANLAVGTAQIAEAAITSAKIKDLAVGSAAIADAAIISAKIADLAVGTAAIDTAAITSAKIANLAVGNAAIANGAITNAKIGDLAVDNAKIANATIVTGKIADAAITTAKIQDASITTAKIETASITSALIVDAAITNAKIGDTIQSGDFVTGSGGWRIQKSGNAELNNATFRGTLDIKSASSGARTQITNSVIKVYDSTGAIRVKIGDLSA